MRVSVASLFVAVLVAVSLGQSQAQQKTGVVDTQAQLPDFIPVQEPQAKQGKAASQRDSLSKTLSDLNEQVKELKERIGTLQTEQGELRARLVQVERTQAFPDNLREVGLDLARFDCTEDQNRAWAMALARGTQGYTLEGAAAMNCTQRLAKITEKAVRSLVSR